MPRKGGSKKVALKEETAPMQAVEEPPAETPPAAQPVVEGPIVRDPVAFFLFCGEHTRARGRIPYAVAKFATGAGLYLTLMLAVVLGVVLELSKRRAENDWTFLPHRGDLDHPPLYGFLTGFMMAAPYFIDYLTQLIRDDSGRIAATTKGTFFIMTCNYIAMLVIVVALLHNGYEWFWWCTAHHELARAGFFRYLNAVYGFATLVPFANAVIYHVTHALASASEPATDPADRAEGTLHALLFFWRSARASPVN